jgi:hypothetical protein
MSMRLLDGHNTMNAEQLHSIVRRLHESHGQVRTVKRLNTARDALQNVVNQPGNPDLQQTYRGAMEALRQALADERITVFTAKEESMLAETGLYNSTGMALLSAVDAAVDNDNFTPALAVQQLAQTHDKLHAQLGRLVNLDQQLGELNIGYDEVGPEDAQVGFYIPRPDSDLTFSQLIEEEKRLDTFIAAANEMVTGKRDSADVKLLTASDYGFLLQLAVPVAAFLTVAIERALAARKMWLEGEMLKKQLASLSVPDENTKGLADHFKKQLDDRIRAGVEEAVTQYGGLQDMARKNELTNEIVIHVRTFTEKTNDGHYVDLKIGPPKPLEEGADEAAASAQSELAAKTREIDLLTRRVHELEHESRRQRRLEAQSPKT